MRVIETKHIIEVNLEPIRQMLIEKFKQATFYNLYQIIREEHLHIAAGLKPEIKYLGIVYYLAPFSEYNFGYRMHYSFYGNFTVDYFKKYSRYYENKYFDDVVKFIVEKIN